MRDGALRFTTRDPFPGFAVLPQTLHPYVYVKNNPINLTDPSGEVFDIPWDLLMLGADFVLLVIDAVNPALDECTRYELMRLDLIALGIDGAALLIFGVPGGGGFAGRLAGREILIFARGGLQVSTKVRIIRVGVQAGVHLAQVSGGGRGSGRGFVKGSSGGSGAGSSQGELAKVAREGSSHRGNFPPNSSHEYLYRTDSTGKITGFARYDSSGNAMYRVDLVGRSHGSVGTPHLQPAIWDTHPESGVKIFRRWGVAVPYVP